MILKILFIMKGYKLFGFLIFFLYWGKIVLVRVGILLNLVKLIVLLREIGV